MVTPVICVTPAGRRQYLDLLKHYVFKDEAICEWHLWDNCRTQEDRSYINELALQHRKIKVVRVEGVDGTNRSVNPFYRFCDNREAFYIKMDDDLTYLTPDLGSRLRDQALSERGKYIWWSPMIINNAICSWLLKYHAELEISEALSCQASDTLGWFDPQFAKLIHTRFLSAIGHREIEKFCVPNFEISLSRFSINCIGFFGKDVVDLGERFCPPTVDDEEWISAVLPSMVRKPGRIVGNVIVAHFSFFTQEAALLQAGLLDKYYQVAGLSPTPYSIKKRPLEQRIFLELRKVKNRIFQQ